MNQITQIRLVISQPQTSKRPSEWDFPVDEKLPHSQDIVRQKANLCFSLIGKSVEEITPHLVEGDKQCQYCKAKVDCPKIANTVAVAMAATDEGFAELNAPTPFDNAALAKLYTKTKLIRQWCDAIDEKVTGLALLGVIGEEHGLKVVTGKEGNRAWSDSEAVEAEMKSMRLKHDQMYNYKLITPTVAEKVLADNPRKWKKLEAMITRSPGGKVVVPLSDKRPAIDVRPTADGFDDAGDDLI